MRKPRVYGPKNHQSLTIYKTAAFVLILFSIYQIYNPRKTNHHHTASSLPDIQIFDLRSNASLPVHLDEIDPTTELVSRGFQYLDTAHRLGRIHMGSWIYIVDSTLTTTTTMASSSSSNPRILLLKRGLQLVTCPGMWGLVGEHTNRDEPQIETVRRAIMEELGPRVLEHVTTHGRIRNVTALPLYYERHYGEANGGRIDRQVTYVWLVEMNLGARKISRDGNYESTIDQIIEEDGFFEFDSEVAETKWLPIDELEQWVKEDTDDKKFFCHETIISLTNLGLERLKVMSL